MAPVGSNVQYLSEKDGHPMAAVVLESFNADCKNLKVFLDGSNSEQHGYSLEDNPNGCIWMTSVVRGEGRGQWRPVPPFPSSELTPDASEDEALAEAAENESTSEEKAQASEPADEKPPGGLRGNAE